MMSQKAKEDMTLRRGNDKRCQITEDDKQKEKIESDKTAMRGNWGAVARVDIKSFLASIQLLYDATKFKLQLLLQAGSMTF